MSTSIHFIEKDDGQKNEILYNNELIGYVYAIDLARKKWKLSPNFDLIASFSNEINKIWNGWYEAGKALSSVYETEIYYLETIDEEEDYEPSITDTQPINMNKFWSNYQFKP